MFFHILMEFFHSLGSFSSHFSSNFVAFWGKCFTDVACESDLWTESGLADRRFFVQIENVSEIKIAFLMMQGIWIRWHDVTVNKDIHCVAIQYRKSCRAVGKWEKCKTGQYLKNHHFIKNIFDVFELKNFTLKSSSLMVVLNRKPWLQHQRRHQKKWMLTDSISTWSNSIEPRVSTASFSLEHRIITEWNAS